MIESEGIVAQGPDVSVQSRPFPEPPNAQTANQYPAGDSKGCLRAPPCVKSIFRFGARLAGVVQRMRFGMREGKWNNIGQF